MENHNVTIALPVTLHRRLLRQCRARSRRTGMVTRSQIIRLALAEWLERAEVPTAEPVASGAPDEAVADGARPGQ